MDPKNIDMFCLLAELENKMCGYPLSLGKSFLDVQKCSPRTAVWAGHPCKRLVQTFFIYIYIAIKKRLDALEKGLSKGWRMGPQEMDIVLEKCSSRKPWRFWGCPTCELMPGEMAPLLGLRLVLKGNLVERPLWDSSSNVGSLSAGPDFRCTMLTSPFCSAQVGWFIHKPRTINWSASTPSSLLVPSPFIIDTGPRKTLELL